MPAPVTSRGIYQDEVAGGFAVLIVMPKLGDVSTHCFGEWKGAAERSLWGAQTQEAVPLQGHWFRLKSQESTV